MDEIDLDTADAETTYTQPEILPKVVKDISSDILPPKPVPRERRSRAERRHPVERRPSGERGRSTDSFRSRREGRFAKKDNLTSDYGRSELSEIDIVDRGVVSQVTKVSVSALTAKFAQISEEVSREAAASPGVRRSQSLNTTVRKALPKDLHKHRAFCLVGHESDKQRRKDFRNADSLNVEPSIKASRDQTLKSTTERDVGALNSSEKGVYLEQSPVIVSKHEILLKQPQPVETETAVTSTPRQSESAGIVKQPLARTKSTEKRINKELENLLELSTDDHDEYSSNRRRSLDKIDEQQSDSGKSGSERRHRRVGVATFAVQ